ncbi:hypothetical protein [Cryptosporangium arvum]|uniref:hypothetical protein n=1 Tax=Cryptosporangium arvum TaxID=80871 RepID=UPI0004B0F4A0|nr:hypothetical protein [Cryptosporangium arvum]
MTPGHREEELRLRLRAAADEHQPDRDAILARIERRRAESAAGPGAYGSARRSTDRAGLGRAGGRRAAGPLGRAGGFGGLRPLAAAGALGAVVALGVSGAWLVGGFGSTEQPDAASAPPPPPVTAVAPTEASGEATPPAPTSSAASPSAASPSARSASPRESSTPRSSRSPEASLPIETFPGGSAPEQGWLWSDGSMDPNSNDNYAQSTVTLKSKTEMTALDVTIRVALSSGVRATGNWSTIAKDKLVVTTRERSGWLYYRFQLRAGATIAPGDYTFAGQYDPGGPRSTGKDAYLASASARTSDVRVHGGF